MCIMIKGKSIKSMNTVQWSLVAVALDALDLQFTVYTLYFLKLSNNLEANSNS